MDTKKIIYKMIDIGKTLILLFAIVLVAGIVRLVFDEYRKEKAGIDFTSYELKEAFVEECIKEGKGFVSKEYCECGYDYITDNYTPEEISQIMAEGFEGESPISLEIIMEACRQKL